METKRSQQLQRIIELSRNMLDKARESGWEQVASLEAERRVLVDDCFSQTTADQDAYQVAAAIREILKLNQSIADLGQQAKDALAGRMNNHTVGKAAQTAYRNCAKTA